MRAVALILLLAAAAAPVRAADDRPSATVRAVIDGDTVVLDRKVRDAREVRLVGIQAPKLPLGRKGFPTWPLAAEAKRFVEDLALGRNVRIEFGTTPVDRHGRLLAHLYLPDGRWLQGEILAAGMARVYTFPDNRLKAGPMYGLERAARRAGRGIWGHPFYAVRAPGELGGEIGTFQVVSGRVVDAARVRGRYYLNFGDNWRTDFTVSISPAAAKSFAADGIDPLAYEHQTIRVRGWLKKRNGPMIEATHPEQIELGAE